ncbi:hypothetical protein NUBL22009_52990 [Klebsiella pneumoniae]|nr:hypothetical protein NUBL22009_52990 [Klebsiella pneumoniae]
MKNAAPEGGGITGEFIMSKLSFADVLNMARETADICGIQEAA